MSVVQAKEILCTLGPASRNERVIKRLEDLGVSLFRINLSHTKTEDVKKVIEEIRAHSDVSICLDTEGAQVRTGSLRDGAVKIETNSVLRIANKAIEGDAKEFNLYPTYIVDELTAGDIISIDFNSVLVQVIEKDERGVIVRVLTGGLLGQNKAVTVDREFDMEPLTEKDKEIIQIGLKMGIKNVALSFANSGKDVEYLRSLVGNDIFIISKIESLSGIRNLSTIADRSNAILIDRGDMSRQLPIERIPRAQKVIIRRAKECGAKVYVATNLLESMITQPNPTRAEVNDIFNTLVDGADGLVLAAETAIGSYPVQCAMMVAKVMQQYSDYANGVIFDIDKAQTNSFLLVEPHGGKLIDRVLNQTDKGPINQYKKLFVNQQTLIDAEQIAIGVYSPLEGFMNEEEIRSVVKSFKLPSGIVWPLPIILQTSKEQAKALNIGDHVALCWEKDKQIYATMKIQEIFQYNLDDLAEEVYKTKDESHPGVAALKQRGSYLIAGKIDLVKRLPSTDKHFEITPKQSRKIFEHKGWSRVVGFHTRNVAHRVHEFIQLKAFEGNHCDGLFIHPLVGPKKKGDYTAQIVLKSYEVLLKKYYPENSALLAAFQSYPRYAGPREAVFTAICRKNFGCSHFIVGRDHSGVGGFYEPDAGHKLFDFLGDIGIKPIYFNEYHYSEKHGNYVESQTESSSGEAISGTQGRVMLMEKTVPPDWFMREDIANLIIDEINQGRQVFIE